jgi:adenylate kinase family enzyme
MGAPGVGKGTFANRIGPALNLPNVSTVCHVISATLITINAGSSKDVYVCIYGMEWVK